MKKIAYFIFVIACFYCLSLKAWGESVLDRNLRVGVVEVAPFVIKKEGKYSGIAIDIWTLAAANAHLKYHFISHPNTNFDDAINSLAQGKYDILVGPISVSEERVRLVDYTLPFYLAHISVLAMQSEFSFLANLLKTLIYTVGALAMVFFVFFFIHIHILWFTEKKRSSKLLGSYRNDLQKIFWGYISEGKYVDIPRSTQGKIIILFWLIIGYTLLAIINGSIVGFITVGWLQFAHPIQKISELRSKEIGADKGSRSYHLARSLEFNVHEVKNIQEGIELLKSKKIDAYITPATEAEAYLQAQREFNVSISPMILHKDLYYFATPLGSPLRHVIDAQIAEIHKTNFGIFICKKYLNEKSQNCNL